MEYSEVRTRIQAIVGLIDDAEAEYLYMLAKNCGGNIVDIGSWQGKSTISLALGSKAGSGGEVFAIDPHHGTPDRHGVEDTEPIFRENIKQEEVDDIVMPMVMKSEEAAKGWTEPISLLWIDGASDYASVKKDFLLYEPHLKEGGFVAFHDVLRPLGLERVNARKIISKYIFPSNKFTNVQFCCSILCATKVTTLSTQDRTLKFWKLLLFYIFPLVHFKPNLGLIIRILARMRMLGLARATRDKLLTLIHRGSQHK